MKTPEVKPWCQVILKQGNLNKGKSNIQLKSSHDVCMFGKPPSWVTTANNQNPKLLFGYFRTSSLSQIGHRRSPWSLVKREWSPLLAVY